MSGQFIFLVMMGLAFSFLPFSLCLLIMHVLMPQAVLDRYWKEPHFRPFELMLMSGWSFFAPGRTIMLMWLFMFPHLGWRRGIIEPHRLIPLWYRIAAIVMNIWMIVMFGGVTAISIGFFIYFAIVGDPRVTWGDHLLLAFGIACIAFALIHQRRINKRNDKALRQRWRKYRDGEKQDGQAKRERIPRRKNNNPAPP